MSLSFLPTPASEHSKQSPEVRFTIRSANSPSYRLSRRPGVRKPKSLVDQETETTEEVGERHGTHIGTNFTNKVEDSTFYLAKTGVCSSVKGQCEETLGHKMFNQLNQNDLANETITDCGTDRSENCNLVSERRGRTDWRRHNLPSRSKSLDWRTGERSPDRDQRTYTFMYSTTQGGDVGIRAEGVDERMTGGEGIKGRVMSPLQTYVSAGNDGQDRNPVSHVSPTFNRVDRVNSFPSRLKLQSGPISDSGTATMMEPQGSQSISERIEQLYWSAGFGKTDDYNNIRDFSKPQRSYERTTGGTFPRNEQEGKSLVENEGKEKDRWSTSVDDLNKYSKLKNRHEIPLAEGNQRQHRNFYIDETDFTKVSSPKEANKKPSYLPLSNSSDISAGVQTTTQSPVVDEDKTPTNTPTHSAFLSSSTPPEKNTPITVRENESTPILMQAAITPKRDSSPHHGSPSNTPNLISPDVSTAHRNRCIQSDLDLNAWLAGLNTKIKVWDNEEDSEDDDESTQKDEDSNYNSDSGESSVTITSNLSQSDHRSFSVSLSDLCDFAGVDYESENDSDEWQPTGQRSASLSSDMSTLSCVSVLPTEELNRLLEDVRSLGDSNLQDYNDVQVVVLHKEPGVGLGFSVAGGLDQNKPVTVHKVFHSGVAAQQGSIKEGDQILSINGTSLCECVHWEALKVLRIARTRNLGVVVLRRGGISTASKEGEQTNNPGPTQTQLTETGQRVHVCLEKNSRDLGFSLQGGAGFSLEDRPLTVQKIFQGGPVDQVNPGDEVLEIEGVSMTGMRRLEAWTLIRRLPPGPVEVVLRRPLKHLET
uniref:PDZ domain-containing protein n=1 Tax=Mola mola TaxID=94237 RepID=A0A3Q3W7H1_MOLML